MSGVNDNIFTRWSKRKLAARSSEDQTPHDHEQALDVSVEHEGSDAQPATPDLEAAEVETGEPPEPLPRIEDLTPESDLSAFLRKGVPKALRSAAMRKMWSLDPGIRDYVGPSEYAWDFNQPGSMAGFGTLEAKEAVVDFLSKIGSAIDREQEETSTAAETLPHQPPQLPPDTPSGQQASLSTDETTPPSDPATPQPQAQPGPPPESASAEVAIGRADSAEPELPPESAKRARHGGAMPR